MHIYQKLNLKNKLSKQEERQNHGYGDHFDFATWEGVLGNG